MGQLGFHPIVPLSALRLIRHALKERCDGAETTEIKSPSGKGRRHLLRPITRHLWDHDLSDPSAAIVARAQDIALRWPPSFLSNTPASVSSPPTGSSRSLGNTSWRRPWRSAWAWRAARAPRRGLARSSCAFVPRAAAAISPLQTNYSYYLRLGVGSS